MLHDIHKREKIENCESCRFYFATPKGEHGNCHRFPPPSATSGHVTVYPLGWCGEYTADPEKMKELGKDHLKMREESHKQLVESHKERGDKARAASPNPQNMIAKHPLK